jgi:Zn finger protein HypA/HybF involved in hydrogenase expression
MKCERCGGDLMMQEGNMVCIACGGIHQLVNGKWVYIGGGR